MLAPWGWAAYAIFVSFMAYTEGYKAFQKQFCPMVVSRAATLDVPPAQRPKAWPLYALFAPVSQLISRALRFAVSQAVSRAGLRSCIRHI